MQGTIPLIPYSLTHLKSKELKAKVKSLMKEAGAAFFCMCS